MSSGAGPAGSAPFRIWKRFGDDLICGKSIRADSCDIDGVFGGLSSTGRGNEVAYYRLYLLAEPGGRFVGFEEIEAPDDVEAARLAEGHVGEHPLELWCGKRKVKSFPARKTS